VHLQIHDPAKGGAMQAECGTALYPNVLVGVRATVSLIVRNLVLELISLVARST
jgi:hypothetical protein